MGNANSGDKTKLEKSIMAQNMSLYDIELWAYLRDPEVPRIDKIKTVMPLACKHVKTEVALSGNSEIVLNIIRNADGKTLDVIDHEVKPETDPSI